MSASFWNRFTGYALGGWHPHSGGRSSVAPFRSARSASGAKVTPETALKISAVWACVNLRGGLVGSLPLHLWDANKLPAKKHPLYNLLRVSPNADMTPSEFWEMMNASVDLWGNAYAEKIMDGRRVIALEPFRPERVTQYYDKGGKRRFRYTEGEKERDFAADQLFHLKGFTLDGLSGLSALQFAAESVGGLSEANKIAAKLFEQGLKAGGFLQTNAPQLTKEQRETIRDALAEFGKAVNAGKWMVLEAGFVPVENKGLQISPIDAQLLQSRYFGIEEICRAFAVPPQIIGHTDKASSWASSLEATNLGFLTYSLRQRLVRYEQAISKQLLPAEDRLTYSPKFVVEGMLRADSAGRAAFYGAGLRDGWLTRNEVRELEDRTPLPGGDILTVQAQMVPLDQLGKATLPLPVPADGAGKSREAIKTYAVIDGKTVEIPAAVAGLLGVDP